MKDPEPKYERYQRQILLKEFGKSSQDKLAKAHVLVIGAGGLGCPVLLYLAAAGIGAIGIADDDKVSVTNLHRQVLFTMNDIGSFKAETATVRLREMNPEIRINAHSYRLQNQNALDVIRSYDLVIDGTDNFATRYMVNDACVLLGKPLISGSVSKFEGQVMVLNAKGRGLPVNYRDIFPDPPSGDEALNCAESGVLGVLTGIIGSLMANEAIKLIANIGQPLSNRLLTYNSLNNASYELELTARPDTLNKIPKSGEEFLAMDYDWFCSSREQTSLEIDIDSFDDLLKSGEYTVIDIREFDETPVVNEFNHLHIPFSEIRANGRKIPGERILLFCQTGQRSLVAAGMLRAELGNDQKIYSLRGGIRKWKQHQHKSHG
jgi:adenylyltransferase/sulfurtransferase